MSVDLYTGPAPQPPPYPARYGRNLLSAVALALVFGYAAKVVELRPLELLRDMGNMGVFLQGSVMDAAEARDFKRWGWWCEAVWLRRLDDAAKVPGVQVPGLEHYRALLQALSRKERSSAMMHGF
jgi:hypothetical protein